MKKITNQDSTVETIRYNRLQQKRGKRGRCGFLFFATYCRLSSLREEKEV